MGSLKKYREIANANGYELWWDDGLRLWTATKENSDTFYWSSQYLKSLDYKTFDNSFKDIL